MIDISVVYYLNHSSVLYANGSEADFMLVLLQFNNSHKIGFSATFGTLGEQKVFVS